jgi:hypothetical protein
MILTKYKEFNEGDEVYTDKKNWKLIIAIKPYIVIKCYITSWVYIRL